MNLQPALRTPQLRLRPFRVEDAGDVRRLAGDRAIAATTLLIPHPYPEGLAEQWIATHAERFEKGELANFAVVHAADNALVGSIGLVLHHEHARAELGYWIGKPFWGNGYATEAGGAMLQYGFETLGLNRIHAGHFSNNPASGKVLQKLGMSHEGCQRQHVSKWGELLDLELYAVLKSEFQSRSAHAPD